MKKRGRENKKKKKKKRNINKKWRKEKIEKTEKRREMYLKWSRNVPGDSTERLSSDEISSLEFELACTKWTYFFVSKKSEN